MLTMQPKFDAFAFNANLDVATVCEHFEALGFALLPHHASFGYKYAYLLELGGLNHGLIQYGGDSVTIHTHKFKIPRKLIILGVFIFSLVAFLVYLGYDSFLVTGEFNKPKESQPAQVQARAAAVPDIYSWAAAEPATPVAGCIANRVPCDSFRLVYYYSRCAFLDHALHIDLLDMFDVCGFTTEGLC